MMVVFYDRSLRLWTAYRTDAEGNQTGAAGYGTTRELAIADTGLQESNMTDYDACAIIEGFDGEDHDEEEIVAAFQHLINTGTVWSLQGFYGRTAARLINSGRCHQ